jgi:hypothetical protein
MAEKNFSGYLYLGFYKNKELSIQFTILDLYTRWAALKRTLAVYGRLEPDLAILIVNRQPVGQMSEIVNHY